MCGLSWVALPSSRQTECTVSGMEGSEEASEVVSITLLIVRTECVDRSLHRRFLRDPTLEKGFGSGLEQIDGHVVSSLNHTPEPCLQFVSVLFKHSV